MSFDINWDKLVEDGELNRQIKEFLDEQFKSLSLPSFISHISVEDFNLGTVPPQITIRHIGDPFPDFYQEEEVEHEDDKVESSEDNDVKQRTEGEDHQQPLRFQTKPKLNKQEIRSNSPNLLSRSQDSISLFIGSNNLSYLQNYNMGNVGIGGINHDNNNGFASSSNLFAKQMVSPSPPSLEIKPVTKKVGENDVQLITEVSYSGDLQINLSVSVLLNYPSPNFVSLPIKLTITDLVIHSIAAIAYLNKAVYFSFLCDIDDSNGDYFANSPIGSNIVDHFAGSNRERIDIIKKIRIQSEIGEAENNVLRNVGQVEKFLVEQLRNVMRDELAWPSWICFDLNGEEDGE